MQSHTHTVNSGKYCLAFQLLQVSKCYQKETARLAPQLMDLLDTHATVLDAALRRTLVQVSVHNIVCKTDFICRRVFW